MIRFVKKKNPRLHLDLFPNMEFFNQTVTAFIPHIVSKLKNGANEQAAPASADPR